MFGGTQATTGYLWYLVYGGRLRRYKATVAGYDDTDGYAGYDGT